MPNRLARETSPYLQQHANNPVDWYPWGEEALTLARTQDKPILLSVGYSACHWCHVMAHESFEDPETAAVMNRLFVSIKVDREERPDIDQIYQTAHQMLAQRPGGWPLTMFLTPDGMPFFGGTYFPKSARYGLSGFVDLMEHVAQIFRTRRQEIAQQNEAVRAALDRTVPGGGAHHSEFSATPLTKAESMLSTRCDERYGGFGDAPKFPHPADLKLLLRRHAANGGGRSREIVLLTLRCMAEGGIFDQIGGGFCRYSVDAQWNIPHFEKMLYDNGPLLGLYADAWLLTGDELFRRVAEETAAWIMREMQSPEGGYYSSLDADSEHEEGKYYVWSKDEVRAVLDADEYAVVAPHYGLARPANFEHRHWHFHVAESLADVARGLGRTVDDCQRLLAAAKAKLFAVRESRVRPGRDEKILASWNALTIEAMAHAAAVFGRDDWMASARRALDFVRDTLWRGGRLLATFKDGRAHLNAYLDDYAFLLAALIEVLQTDFRREDLEWAEDVAEVLLEQFEDRSGGGFFFTSHDHERLIHRAKIGHDNATPSGNGVAALALQRLGHLTGEGRYPNAAERTLQLFYPPMLQDPSGFATLAMALEEAMAPPRLIVLRGDDAAVRTWQERVRRRYLPHTLVLGIGEGLSGLPPVLDKAPGNPVNAWVCSGVTCLPPIDDVAELERVLDAPL
jgi:uncharacterized protein YyaL (SSP411 family)